MRLIEKLLHAILVNLGFAEDDDAGYDPTAAYHYESQNVYRLTDSPGIRKLR